jgi:hypothetical protein
MLTRGSTPWVPGTGWFEVRRQALYRASTQRQGGLLIGFTAPKGSAKITLKRCFPLLPRGIPSLGVTSRLCRGIAMIAAHAAEMSAWRNPTSRNRGGMTRCVDTDRPAYGYRCAPIPGGPASPSPQ